MPEESMSETDVQHSKADFHILLFVNLDQTLPFSNNFFTSELLIKFFMQQVQQKVLVGIGVVLCCIVIPQGGISLIACEVGFAVDVVLQELSGGCPTSRNPFE
ncbi:hypothetical protein P5673_018207 [Acropora cervicornis]|uniref:Uncharacterized protein n=1 Tax=Acropora cervicornis TaxID=6130 RepID=A0AAD9QDW9_ACRCE|nr:hypothetical protein P5673_018207 [Acropora cervicornis]